MNHPPFRRGATAREILAVQNLHRAPTSIASNGNPGPLRPVYPWVEAGVPEEAISRSRPGRAVIPGGWGYGCPSYRPPTAAGMDGLALLRQFGTSSSSPPGFVEGARPRSSWRAARSPGISHFC